MFGAPTRLGRAGARAWIVLVLALGTALGASAPAGASAPLFTFAQISDSQPTSPEQWARFELVLDTIAAAGGTGALIPRPVDFVLFAGDLVSHAENQGEWVQFVDTIDSRLTANGIPYRAVPGNHDQQGFGVGFYEFFVANSGVWDADSGTVVGQNGPVVHTGWSGLRIIGFNNSNGAWNSISAEDQASIAARVGAAAAANENVYLLGHHPHDGEGLMPLAAVLDDPSICCYGRGHSGSPGARRGLDFSNPDIWDLNTNSIVDDGAILYVEAFANELRVYVVQLVWAPTVLAGPTVVPLASPLYPTVPVAPTADFSATPLSGTAPLEVSFTDLSTGTPTSWQWSFGDGGSSTQEHPRYTYTEPGVYDVTLQASNQAGSDVQNRSGYVTVLPAPPAQTFLPVADARVKSASPTSNYGDEDELRVRTGSTTFYSYLRFDVSGLDGASVLSAKLRLYATDASDDGGAVHSVSNGWTESGITWENAPPIGGAPAAPGAAIFAGFWREIDVSSVVTGEGIYSFGLASASSNSAYYSSREGVNPPELVVQTSPSATPVADFSGAPTQGSAPLSVDFADLSTGGPTSWLWTFGDGASSTEQHPSHTYAATGVYDVRLQVWNANGSDSRTRSAFVQVTDPAPPVADFSVWPISGTAPLDVAFTDLSTEGPTAWLWSFGDGATSTEQSPTHVYTSPGVYDVTLVATNAAGSDTRVAAGAVTVSEGLPIQVLRPVADARVSSSRPTRNYGSDDALRVRGGSSIHLSFLRFDLQDVAGLGIVSAKLRLYSTDGSSDGGSVQRVDGAWDEDTITWNNAPALPGVALDSAGAVTTGTWVELDVTSAVGGVASVDFALVGYSSNSAYYSSREGTNPPELVIETGAAVAPVADFSGSPLAGPAPLEVSFEGLSSGGPSSWLWSFGDGQTSTERSPVHVYASPGIYDVTLSVANAEGSDSLTRSAFVVVSDALPIASFAPAADAKVSSSSPDVNYGSEPNLRVRSSSSSSWRSFLRFDVAGLDAPVARATLRLFAEDGSRNGGDLHRVSTAWSEGAITWNGAPALGVAPLASLGRTTTGTWVEIDVTSEITGNGSYAFGLANDTSDSAYYGSREGLNPPELLIELVE